MNEAGFLVILTGMTDRIPASLNWLVKKRRRTQSEITHERKKLKTHIYKKEAKLKELESNLEAIDRTIRLHDISINPNKIPKLIYHPNSQKFKYGELTRMIYHYLGSIENKGASTIEIMRFVASKKDFDLNVPVHYKRIYRIVRRRLQNLRSENKLCTLLLNREAIWYIKN